MDIAAERAALISLLFKGPQMQWAKLRDSLDGGILFPTELEITDDDIQRGQRIIESWVSKAAGADFYTYLDAGYPGQLRSVWDFPPFVFLKGDQSLLQQHSGDVGVSVVGSRKPSRGAQVDAARIVRGLIHHEITIVSGLAEGIDQVAHQVALQEGARTVGVIGTGIDQYYPKSSRQYQQAMESGSGMVLSQFVPGAPPTRYSFPMRNGVMSAYGRATIIVEASEQSGTRHQAHHAVKHGRPVILAEPVARATNWGAALAEDPSIDAHVADSPDHAVHLALEAVNQSSPAILKEAAAAF